MELIQVPVHSIKKSKWDVRRTPYPEEDFENLKISISTNGLIHPIAVVRTENKDLVIVAGRHRLKAIKQLGWKNIPAVVLFNDATEGEIRNLTTQENRQRYGINDIETGYAILARFEPEGYKPEQVIEGVKSIDNWFAHNIGKGWKELIEELSSSIIKRGPKESPLRNDPKFIKLCRSMAISPKYQYQCLQVILQLDPKILQKATKSGLTTKKKLLLTHTKLREHPKLQEDLITEIKHLDFGPAAIVVRQVINDLETGYIKKDGSSYTYSGKGKDSREKVSDDPNTEERTRKSYYLKLMEASHKMTYQLVGRALTKGEYKYTKEIVENGNEYRYQVVKSFNGDIRQLNSLRETLVLMRIAANDMLEIIDSELEVAAKKQEMSSR